MGARGPVPKRSEERMGHRSKKEKADVSRPVRVDTPSLVDWPDADPLWHPIARDWYLALQQSGQSVFYEPSDIATARFVAEAMHRNLENGRFSAQLFAAVSSAMSNLLVTEGDRRRVRIELERRQPASGPEVPAAVTALADYRNALGG